MIESQNTPSNLEQTSSDVIALLKEDLGLSGSYLQEVEKYLSPDTPEMKQLVQDIYDSNIPIAEMINMFPTDFDFQDEETTTTVNIWDTLLPETNELSTEEGKKAEIYKTIAYIRTYAIILREFNSGDDTYNKLRIACISAMINTLTTTHQIPKESLAVLIIKLPANERKECEDFIQETNTLIQEGTNDPKLKQAITKSRQAIADEIEAKNMHPRFQTNAIIARLQEGDALETKLVEASKNESETTREQILKFLKTADIDNFLAAIIGVENSSTILTGTK